MRNLFLIISICSSFIVSAQESNSVVYSELRFLDTLLAKETVYKPSLQNYQFGDPLYINCRMEKTINDYIKEFNLDASSKIDKKIIINQGSYQNCEKLISDFDTLHGFDNKYFSEKIFEKGNSDLLLWRMLEIHNEFLRPDDYTFHFDFVLMNDKGVILKLLGSSRLTMIVTQESIDKNVNELKGKSHNKGFKKGLAMYTSNMSSKKKDDRRHYLSDSRDEYRNANESQMSSLRGKDVKSISINLKDGQKLKYRSSVNLIITAELSNGRRIVPKDSFYGDDRTFKEYNIELKGASFETGKLLLYNSFD